MLIDGEAGIGKTALVDEFERRVAGNVPDLRIARGQCIEDFGGTEPYYPALQAVGELCHTSSRESVVAALAEHAPTWLVQFPALLTPERREILQREILGATRQRMVREICDALEAMASTQPLMLVFEDLHWVDPSTIDLISALARRRSAARLILLGTSRPVDAGHPLNRMHQDLVVHRLCQEILLDPLTERAVARVLEVAGVAGVSFSTTITAAAMDVPPEHFEEICDRLSRRQRLLRAMGVQRLPDGTLFPL